MIYSLVDVIKNKNGTGINWYIIKDPMGNIGKFRSNQLKYVLNRGDLIDGLKLVNGRLIRDNTKTINRSNKLGNIAAYYSGDDLIAYIKTNLVAEVERDLVNQIYNFCESNITNKVCIIHGIRRTGKTTAVLHTIKRLISSGVNAEDIGYIDIRGEIHSIKKFLDKVEDLRVKYLFIDEITLINRVDGESSFLANHLAGRMKIVITGTDSYVFPRALKYSLYDRAVVLHSTQIPYSEYKKLFKQSNLEWYMTNGGVLIGSEFNSIKNSYDTLKSVIITNIKNTIKRSSYTIEGLTGLGEDQMTYIIFNILYKLIRPKSDTEQLKKKKETSKRVAKFLQEASNIDASYWVGIDKRTPLGKEYGIMLEALYELDILRYFQNLAYKSEYLGVETQFELVCLIQGLAYSIINTKSNKESVVGDVFENMIVSNIIMWKELNGIKCDIGYCRYKYDGTTREVDAVIRYEKVDLSTFKIKNKYVLIEIKRGSKYKSDFGKNLNHESINEVLPGEHKKLVIYAGPTETHNSLNVINANEFLMDIGKWVGVE